MMPKPLLQLKELLSLKLHFEVVSKIMFPFIHAKYLGTLLF